MIAMRMKTTPLALAVATVLMLAGATSAHAAVEPTKFVPSLRFGWNVDKSTGASICLVAEASCGEGEISAQPGGFSFPSSVAVAKDGNVYVADNAHHRIQEFTATGEFVLMFGWNVNVTKVTEGAPQAARDVCTAAEVKAGAECLGGEAGTGESTENAGQMLKEISDVAVDRSTGDLYVFDGGYDRVDEFTENGEFILMIGGDVNKTNVGKAGASEAEKNLCTAASHDVCEPGTAGSGHGVVEADVGGGFNGGDLLTVGGPEGLLYFGDGMGVQEFHTEGAENGEWAGEISLAGLSPTAAAEAIVVDSSGDVFVAGSKIFGVHEYNGKGELQSLVIDPEGQAKGQFIKGLALDFYGRLGVIEQEPQEGIAPTPALGLLYKPSGELVGEFTPPSGTIPGGPAGLAFDASSASDQLYVAESRGQAVEVYVPVVFPEVKSCAASEVLATTATLCGEVNPNGVLAKGFFEYRVPGLRQLQTPVAFEGQGTVLDPYEGHLAGLVPNQTYEFNAVVEALAEGAEKQAAGEALEFHTATPPPVIVGEPSASFVKAQSAVLEASLNPEHATTSYHFEYRACNALGECSAPLATPVETSSQYGIVGFTQEVTGLAPLSTYRYRLVANNEHEEAGQQQGGAATGAEGEFTTGPAPSVRAATGPAGAVTTTSAVVSGEVDPDGQPATYAFELGVYSGAGTQYGIVLSGPAGEGTAALAESLALTGLQPGTTYAYRIKLTSGYGSATGEAALFTTAGLPEVLVAPASLPMLTTPAIVFPAEAKVLTTAKQATPKCVKGKVLSHGRCVKTKTKQKKRGMQRKAKKTSRSRRTKR